MDEQKKRIPGATRDIEPDPVIEFYKKDLDRSLFRENRKRTIEERFERLMQMQRDAEELKRAGAEARRNRRKIAERPDQA